MCHWTSGDHLCRIWNKLTEGNGMVTLKNGHALKLAGENVSMQEADVIIVVNSCQDYSPSFKNLAKTIFLKMEPIYFDSFWSDLDARFLIAKINHTSDCFNNLEWHLNKTRADLDQSNYEHQKIHGHTLSSILSSKIWDQGQFMRLSFALKAQHHFHWHAYGAYHKDWLHYKGAPEHKDEALIPYKYSFAAENTFLPGYVTEKLIDCIMAETLCFYAGAPNVASFLNPLAFVAIDLFDHDKTIDLIQSMIDADTWEKRLPFIQQEKKRLLHELTMFPRIASILDKSKYKQNEDEKY